MKQNMKNFLTGFIFFVSFYDVVMGKYDPLINTDKDCLTNRTLVETAPGAPPSEESMIESLNFNDPAGYPNNKRCGWYLHSSNGTGKISIAFGLFDIENSKRCSKYDYVKTYKQGKGQDDWDQFGEEEGYCGNLPSFTLTTFASSVFIEFVSDGSRNGVGFNASYSLQFPSGPPRIVCLGKQGDKSCNRRITANERGSIILECKVEATPMAAIEWRKKTTTGHEAIRRSLIKRQTDFGVLELTNLELSPHDDEGTYQCMAKNKYNQVEEVFHLTVTEKCKCPKEITVVWYNYPPYTQYLTGFDRRNKPNFKGIMYTILDKMVVDVCGNCKRGHGTSTIVWATTNNRQKSLKDVKDTIDTGKFDVALPILSTKDSQEYRGHYFLPLFDAPGFTFLTSKNKEGGKAVFGAVWSCAPVLGITVVLAILAGIIIWMLDTYWNEEEFPRTFFQGIAQGAWWAYITMTTVGYGDIAPRGYLGRAFAVVWIMAGLVIVSILTGAISTALTIATLESELALYGANLGAIYHTEEYKFGVTRNADMKGYSKFKDIVSDTDDHSLQGCLVDTYVAGYHTELHGLQKNSIIDMEGMVYGTVFGDSISDPFVYKEFKAYVEWNKAMIELAISESITQLPDPEAFDLMDPKSKMYITAVVSCLGMLLLFSLAGLSFEYGYLKPRHHQVMDAKNLDMLESEKIKTMAKSAGVMKETILEEMNTFYQQWDNQLQNLDEKHEHQQDYFQGKHINSPSEIEMAKLEKQDSTTA